MSSDWSLIVRGFFVAGIGTTSTILYILAISAAFVGRFSLAGGAAVAGILSAIAFLRLIGGYLDALDQREASETIQMKPHGEITEVSRSSPAEN